jgi:preprotein translocase SecE subunit
MARNRQRAKQRQAARRAARLEERRSAERRSSEPAQDRSDGDVHVADPQTEAQLAAGAPPQDAGRSDTVLEAPPPPPDTSAAPEPAIDGGRAAEAAEDAAEDIAAQAPPTRREAGERPRFIQFLIAVWAELKRVQWPNRQALTTLTAVVLGFVLIAGGYLGLLDAIFSRIIQAIL